MFDTAAERAAMAAHLRLSEHEKNSRAPRYSVLLALLLFLLPRNGALPLQEDVRVDTQEEGGEVTLCVCGGGVRGN